MPGGVSQITSKRRAAYIHVWSIVVIHGHGRELGANVDHGFDKQIHYRIIFRKTSYSLLYEFEADTALVLNVPKEIRHERVVFGVRLPAMNSRLALNLVSTPMIYT